MSQDDKFALEIYINRLYYILSFNHTCIFIIVINKFCTNCPATTHMKQWSHNIALDFNSRTGHKYKLCLGLRQLLLKENLLVKV